MPVNCGAEDDELKVTVIVSMVNVGPVAVALVEPLKLLSVPVKEGTDDGVVSIGPLELEPVIGEPSLDEVELLMPVPARGALEKPGVL